MYSSAGWVDHGLSSFDYGAIAIAPEQVQTQIGNFGYSPVYATNPSDRLVTVAGYPAGRGESGELYYDVRRVNGYNETILYYNTDTSGGQSGGPVFVLGNDNSYYAIAIHTTGGTNANWGRRIDADVLTNIVAWSKQSHPLIATLAGDNAESGICHGHRATRQDPGVRGAGQ
jgi:V8-like Glu-specific endopeptidase